MAQKLLWNNTEFVFAALLVVAILITFSFYFDASVFGKFGFGEELTAETPEPLIQPQTQSEISYVYANGQRIASVSGNEVKFYHSDYLGSSRVVTDESGNVIASSDAYPFGSVLNEYGQTDKYTFTGKELDATGLQYFGARYYSSDIGRFTQVDPLGPGYVYAANNPMKFIDPTGMQNEELFGPPEPGQTWSEFRRGIKPRETLETLVAEGLGIMALGLTSEAESRKYRGNEISQSFAPGTTRVGCSDIFHLCSKNVMSKAPKFAGAEEALEYYVEERGWELVVIIPNSKAKWWSSDSENAVMERAGLYLANAKKGHYKVGGTYAVDLPVSHVIADGDVEKMGKMFYKVPFGPISYQTGLHSGVLVYGQSVEIHIGQYPAIDATDFLKKIQSQWYPIAVVAVPPGSFNQKPLQVKGQ